MGWKSFKEKYGIEHTVHITDRGLCIGSGYVSDLVVIDLNTGLIFENDVFDSFLEKKYPLLLKETPREILAILQEKDVFQKSLPVFTYEGSKIIQEYTEEYGYPNNTHSGKLMYDNVFFNNREQAIVSAKKENSAFIKYIENTINEYNDKIYKLKNDLLKLESEKADLDNLWNA